MKTSLLIIVYLTLLLQNGFAQVTISGKILNYDGESIVGYHPTLEGIYAPFWKEVKPKSNGNFTIQFENAGFGTTTLFFQSLVYRFFHDADSRIYFEIDQGKINRPDKYASSMIDYIEDSIKQLITQKIEGDYQEINQFYNSQLRTAYATTGSVSGNYYSKKVYEAKTPQRVRQVLDSLTQLEIDQIDQLSFGIDLEDPTADKKTQEITNFLKNEVQAFYGGILLNGMFLKRKEQTIILKKDSTAKRTIYNKDWEKFIEEEVPVYFSDLDPIINSPDYIENLYFLQVTFDSYTDYENKPSDKTLDEHIVDALFNYDSRFFKDEKAAYAYSLHELHSFILNQAAYSPILLHSIYELQKQYPDYHLIEHYNPQIENLQDYLDASQGTFSGGKIIRKNYDTFKELISRFEGENILLDIWATWCGPCIQEFEHKEKLASMIEDDNIQFLYISIDRQEWKDRWKNSIKYNQLDGYHYHADQEFIVDMWATLGGHEGAIPRYALIDKNGQIFMHTAARPSEGEELVSQINDLIQETN